MTHNLQHVKRIDTANGAGRDRNLYAWITRFCTSPTLQAQRPTFFQITRKTLDIGAPTIQQLEQAASLDPSRPPAALQPYIRD